jgi:outer membrane receptor protein involved in Fe transport
MDMFSSASNDEFYGGDTFGWRGFPSCLTSAATSTTCVAAKYDQTANFNMTHDVSVRYRADKWSVIVGVQNVLNQDPPYVSTGSGATRIGNAVAISNYDVLGRRAFATLTYKF